LRIESRRPASGPEETEKTMLKIIRERLSVKISLQLVALAIPLLSVAVWRAATDERASYQEVLLERGRVAALSGAAAYGTVLESGVDAGAFSLQELLDPDYEEISFPEALSALGGVTPPTSTKASPALASPFATTSGTGAVSPSSLASASPTGATPSSIHVEYRRYHTKFDGYTDAHGVQQIEDAILGSSSGFLYASGIDRRGYVPTPHKKYAQPPTGDVVHDRAVSRAKRKYEDPEQLAAAGYMGDGTIVLDYHRDTGEAIWDVAAPIRVHGRHWGAFRVGVVRDQLDARTAELVFALGRVLGVAVLLLGVAIFFATRRATRPLGELACAATRLSTTHDGSELEKPIRVASSDEVGQMARALERLRQSLRVAFRRE
jgi:HAMP domain-containing protein